MKVSLPVGVILRPEPFGGTVYVHDRNDFFFLDRPNFELVSKLTYRVDECEPQLKSAYRELAKLGICETSSPAVKECSRHAPNFIGYFDDIPKVQKPLVLNCFTTAHCPLSCQYCHADDLMKPLRETESDEHVDAVINTARKIDSLVAVITGGDPLTEVDRAIRLIEGISGSKALVLDTSGVPRKRQDVDKLIPVLVKNKVHARVSLDEFDDVNKRSRPVNPRYVKDGRTSYSHAEETIKKFVAAGIPTTVQTVLSSFNDNPVNLFDFAKVIRAWGVKHWVIHVTVLAGKAGQLERRRQVSGPLFDKGILPEADGLRTLRTLIRLIEREHLPIDLRVTSANSIKHAVFLVSSTGDLYTEGMAKLGKKLSFYAKEIKRDIDIWKDVDAKAHAARYSGWIEGLFGDLSLQDLTTKI